MLVPIGTKVKLIHSNDLGIVTGWLDDSMLRVKLFDSGMEIPVFPDMIKLLELPTPKTKAKIVSGKKPQTIPPPPREEPKQQYILLKEQGIQMAFDSVFDLSGQLKHYDVYLINTTNKDLLYEINLQLSHSLSSQTSGKLPAQQATLVGQLNWDALNDNPIYDIICKRVSTQGIEHNLEHTLKIKPSQFFKASKDKTAPILNRKVKLYKIFDSLEPTKKKKNEDLKTYTKQNLVYKPSSSPKTGFGIDLAEAARFPLELDLHIEALIGKKTKVKSQHILDIQLSHLESYLNKAIVLGVNRVFIIHGVGSGTLKNAIARRLDKIPEVKTYKNEFHPNYKFGATEVIFK